MTANAETRGTKNNRANKKDKVFCVKLMLMMLEPLSNY